VLEGWTEGKPQWSAFTEQFLDIREGIVSRAHRIYSNFLKLTGKPFRSVE
jgi:hypothetical protein